MKTTEAKTIDGILSRLVLTTPLTAAEVNTAFATLPPSVYGLVGTKEWAWIIEMLAIRGYKGKELIEKFKSIYNILKGEEQ